MKPEQIVDDLIKQALEVRENAYAPYSELSVGAALLGKSGRVYTGCNVENISYGLTICAERVAILKAISEGERDFEAIAIIADMEVPVPPCGACRQVLAEFSPEINVIMVNLSRQKNVMQLSELFPEPFVS
jgi:cytidine deaminase